MKKFVSALSLLFITSASYSSTWTRTFVNDGYSSGYDVILSKDSCYVVLGNVASGIWLLKVNKDGVLIWDKKFTDFSSETGYSIETTYDGGYIITGQAYYGGDKVLLMKTDSIGTTLWIKTFNMTSYDRGYCVRQTIDSGYIIEGSTYNDGNMLLIKTDKNGTAIWKKNFTANRMDLYGGGVCEAQDSNYIAVGDYYNSTDTMQCLLILKINKIGDTLWSKHLFGHKGRGYTGDTTVHGRCIRQTLDKNYIIIANQVVTCQAYSLPPHYYTYYSTYLIKMDSNGDTLWTKKIPDYYQSVYPTKDSEYVLTGGTNLLKVNITGIAQWTNSFFGAENYSVKETYDNGYIIAGNTSQYIQNNGTALYLIKSDPGAVEETTPLTNDKFFSVYPNPVSANTTVKYSLPNKTNISLQVFDLTGRLVKTLYSGEQAAGTHNMSLKSSELSKGIYFVTLNAGSATKTQKLTILR